MKEFELSLRLRNNCLKSRRVAAGLSAQQVAEQAGISYHQYLGFENLRLSPYGRYLPRRELEWRHSALKIAEFWKADPSELWPDAVVAVKHPEVTREVAAETALALASYAGTLELPAAPDELLERREMREIIGKAMNELVPIEAMILRRRYEQDLSASETARQLALGVHTYSPETVRKWEASALGKLRRAVLADCGLPLAWTVRFDWQQTGEEDADYSTKRVAGLALYRARNHREYPFPSYDRAKQVGQHVLEQTLKFIRKKRNRDGWCWGSRPFVEPHKVRVEPVALRKGDEP